LPMGSVGAVDAAGTRLRSNLWLFGARMNLFEYYFSFLRFRDRYMAVTPAQHGARSSSWACKMRIMDVREDGIVAWARSHDLNSPKIM
jgi:hypothetical protein